MIIWKGWPLTPQQVHSASLNPHSWYQLVSYICESIKAVVYSSQWTRPSAYMSLINFHLIWSKHLGYRLPHWVNLVHSCHFINSHLNWSKQLGLWNRNCTDMSVSAGFCLFLALPYHWLNVILQTYYRIWKWRLPHMLAYS